MKMFVSAHVDTKTSDIVVRKTMMQNKQQHKAGTLLLTDALLGGNVRGILVEEHERVIMPRKAIASWPRLRYVTSKGYVDALTGEKVDKAKAVYMAGTKAYYMPV